MGAVAVGATVYFGSEESDASAGRSPSPFTRARARHGDGAVVLRAQQRIQEDGVN